MDEAALIEHPALLVMDMQRGVVDRLGNEAGLLEHFSTAIAAARSANIPVIYVVVRFRNGYPEVNARNRSMLASRPAGTALNEGNPAAEIHPALAPRPDDIVVTKRRISAFAGSDLGIVLRAQGIDSLILTGIATSGVVLSTLRYAADLDYRLTVLSDCVADGDPEVNRVLLDKVFPRQATVLTVAAWQATLQKP